MSDSEIKNAIIRSVKLGFSDRGFLDAWLDLDYGGSGQGFGGYTLYLPPSFSHHKLESPAGHFLFRAMVVAGVESWDQMAGRSVRVKANHSGVEAIGHIVKDDWFCPKDDFAALNK